MKRKYWYLFFGIAVVSLLTLSACGGETKNTTSSSTNTSSTSSITVPNVIGQDYKEAKRLLESKGLKVSAVEQDASEVLPNNGWDRTVKKGEVFSVNSVYDKNYEDPSVGTNDVTIEYAKSNYTPKKTGELTQETSKQSSTEVKHTEKPAGTIENPAKITFKQVQEMTAQNFLSKYKDQVIKFDGYVYILDQASGDSVKDVAVTLDRTDVNGGALKDADFLFKYLYKTDVSMTLAWMLDDAHKATEVINERTIDGSYDNMIPVTVTAKVSDVTGEDDMKSIVLETIELPNNEANVKSR
jgi:hypothetical protein